MKYFLLILLVLTAVAYTQDNKKKCPGHFSAPVANLCGSHFPDTTSEKIWLVKFYAPWCGHCNQMKGKYLQLAKDLKDNKDIGIGAVDCTAKESQALCQKFGVQGYPTIKAIVNGKPKKYEGARETAQMKQFILQVQKQKGTSGGSTKCPKGIFVSGVLDSIISLCDKHHPDQKSQNHWLVTYYNKAQLQQYRKQFNTLARDFGNQAPDNVKSKRQAIHKVKFLEALNIKHEFGYKIDEPRFEAPGIITKFGAVCCDCDEQQTTFCASKDVGELPSFVYIHKSKVVKYDGDMENKAIAKFILDNIGIEKPKKKSDL